MSVGIRAFARVSLASELDPEIAAGPSTREGLERFSVFAAGPYSSSLSPPPALTEQTSAEVALRTGV